MNIIFSFWTKPFNTNNLIGRRTNGSDGGVEVLTKEIEKKIIDRTVKYYEISAKCFKRAGYKVTLFTDRTGKELVDNKLYDSVRMDLEEINSQPAELWSIAKIFSLKRSLEEYKCPVIHVDHDIFFTKIPEIKNRIEGSNWDVLVQSKEVNEHYYKIYDKSLEIFCQIFQLDPLGGSRFLRTFNYAYNCGFLGFKDLKTAKLYIDSYNQIYNKIASDLDKLNKYIYIRAICGGNHWLDGAKANVNCIIEQIVLTQVVNYYNLYAKEILPMSFWGKDPTKNIIKYNKKMGYYHASGNSKYLDDSTYNKIISEFDI